MAARGIYVYLGGQWQLRTATPGGDPNGVVLTPSNTLLPSNILVPKG